MITCHSEGDEFVVSAGRVFHVQLVLPGVLERVYPVDLEGSARLRVLYREVVTSVFGQIFGSLGEREKKHRSYISRNIYEIKWLKIGVPFPKIQSILLGSYPDTSDLRLIRTYLRPPFRDDQRTVMWLIRISHYSYHFIRCLAIRIRRIPLYFLFLCLVSRSLQ